MAIDAGYRLIDTAWAYQNEVAIGNAVRSKIAQGKVKRSDMFIVTKVEYHFDSFRSANSSETLLSFSCGTHFMRAAEWRPPVACR